ncbi:substrate-binding periplasmic protein [Suttonella ornithocola]|uniref:Probable amino-acid ABC transporter-binding protein HI_1080 n=1 Tax=Suttonella ornithocola TaxID=279832 RepID=A0A380MVF6_9GAMM|nr:transporter substrate-binding domain-containing protein [Suttonella ornithocola]SUO96278.1 Probable amino-acid ABC transporter-binding protein HI_1080 precursor [Suttonella ornithocola]
MHYKSSSTEIKETKVTTSAPTFKVLSYIYTPFVERDEQGNIGGFETDILRAIAANQNIQLNFSLASAQTPWSTMFDMLADKQEDLLSAGMYANDERRKRFDISDPYMKSQFAFLAKGQPVNTLEDLKGKKLALMENSIAYREIEPLAQDNNITIVPIKSVYSGVSSVIRGDADVIYGDQVVLAYYANRFNKDKLFFHVNESAKKYHFAFLITKGNTELLNKINVGLAAIKEDGTLQQIIDKWTKVK